jgi:hypothetical protein
MGVSSLIRDGNEITGKEEERGKREKDDKATTD